MRTKKIKLSDGSQLEIKELPIGKYNQVLKLLKDLPQRLAERVKSQQGEDEEVANQRITAQLPELLAEFWPDLIDILSLATGLSKKKLAEDTGLDDGLSIIEAVLEVNNIQGIVKTVRRWISRVSENSKADHKTPGSDTSSTPSQKSTGGAKKTS